MSANVQIITIDGPVASGKSTIAALLAQDLGYFYLNTGLLYRGFAYAVYQEQIDPTCMTDDDIDRLITQLRYTWDNAHAHLFFKDVECTVLLDTQEIDQAASCTSALPRVRRHIDAWQHMLAADHNVVVDGRDSGSVVFAHAQHKFYITASDDVRVQRWISKQIKRGVIYSHAEALAHIKQRDTRDMQRAVAPLTIPVGASVIVNDGDRPLAVIDTIKHLIVT